MELHGNPWLVSLTQSITLLWLAVAVALHRQGVVGEVVVAVLEAY
jgi:hypothetical protein